MKYSEKNYTSFKKRTMGKIIILATENYGDKKAKHVFAWKKSSKHFSNN